MINASHIKFDNINKSIGSNIIFLNITNGSTISGAAGTCI
jgi:hypothetical protein